MCRKTEIIDPFEKLPLPPEKSLHLAIGMFDGVHLGHQAVIESAVKNARRRPHGLSGVLTFHPHPSAILRPDSQTQLIVSRETKNHLLAQLGVDFILWKSFDQDFAQLTAEQFVAHLVETLPNLSSIHVGDNFRFGQGRRGTTELLLAEARRRNLHVFSVKRHTFDGEPISSSRIRQLLQLGQIRTVNSLLGYSYFAYGTVIQGAQLGRTLGFPTLNLPWQPACTPRFGVYAMRVFHADHDGFCPNFPQTPLINTQIAPPNLCLPPQSPINPIQDVPSLPAVANFGIRPTVAANSPPILEIHLLQDKTTLTTGSRICSQWLHFIRPEQRFPTIEHLKEQIAIDKDEARKLLLTT